MKRPVESAQRKMRQMFIIVDGTGTASISGPSSLECTLTDNGTGDYTLTFDKAFAQAPVATVTMVTTNTYPRIHASSTSSIQIKTLQVADGSTATDADFHIVLTGCDVSEKYDS